MIRMSTAARKELFDLVSDLSDDDVPAARRYLQYLRDLGSDRYLQLDGQDPFANMPDDERVRLHAALDQSEREFVEGKGIPAETVLLGLRKR